jgi:glycosyltransferase involved in cell wall biosynthesis
VLISPSTQESFGLVLLEAWARSKPVIAADIPASSELINKTNGGLIFKTNDSDDLTKKINILLKDSRLQKQLGRNGFKYVQSHATWDRIGQALWSKISSS